MAQPRAHLSKAPAREALIDIQFEPALELERVSTFIKAALPSFERQTELREAFVGLAQGSATASQRLVGWRLDCAQSHFVLMCTTTGFTLSRLSPYGDWANLRDEAAKWWRSFCETVSPYLVTRIAVRYVNAIALPVPVSNFADYLTCPPTVPTELPQGVSGFLQRVIVPDVPNDCTSIITQALESPAFADGAPPSVTVLLDIDVFRTVRFVGEHRDQLWSALDELRAQKNRVFFGHITERTVEMFE